MLDPDNSDLTSYQPRLRPKRASLPPSPSLCPGTGSRRPGLPWALRWHPPSQAKAGPQAPPRWRTGNHWNQETDSEGGGSRNNSHTPGSQAHPQAPAEGSADLRFLRRREETEEQTHRQEPSAQWVWPDGPRRCLPCWGPALCLGGRHWDSPKEEMPAGCGGPPGPTLSRPPPRGRCAQTHPRLRLRRPGPSRCGPDSGGWSPPHRSGGH